MWGGNSAPVRKRPSPRKRRRKRRLRAGQELIGIALWPSIERRRPIMRRRVGRNQNFWWGVKVSGLAAAEFLRRFIYGVSTVLIAIRNKAKGPAKASTRRAWLCELLC